MKLDCFLIIQWQKILHIYRYLIATAYREIFDRAILIRKTSKEKTSVWLFIWLVRQKFILPNVLRATDGLQHIFEVSKMDWYSLGDTW